MSDRPGTISGSNYRCRKPEAHYGIVLWRAPIPGDPKAKHVTSSPYLSEVGLDPRSCFRLFEDFEQASSGTLPGWLATQDTSAAGTPTLDFVDDAAGGQFQLLQDNTDEAQNLTLYQGDQLTFDVTKKPIFQTRVKLDADALPLSADERLVIGLASARNATLDSVATHAWFRVEGGSNNLLWETDDGTTDDDDNDTGIDIADDTWITLRVDCTDLATVRFLVDAEDGNGFKLVGTGSLAAATGNLQVFIELQKDAGTETEDLRIDYVLGLGQR